VRLPLYDAWERLGRAPLVGDIVEFRRRKWKIVAHDPLCHELECRPAGMGYRFLYWLNRTLFVVLFRMGWHDQYGHGYGWEFMRDIRPWRMFSVLWHRHVVAPIVGRRMERQFALMAALRLERDELREERDYLRDGIEKAMKRLESWLP